MFLGSMRFKPEVVNFIKNSEKSYSQIIKDLKEIYNIKAAKSSISYYKKKKSRIISINFNKIYKWAIEWLIGLYYADGCKFLDKDYKYTIKFKLDSRKDIEIAHRLINIIKKLGLNPIISYENGDVKDSIIVVRIYSKLLFNFLPKKSKVYKPKNIYAFVSGLIDGDGYFSREENRLIITQCTHRRLMKYLSKILCMSCHVIKNKTRWGNFKKTDYYIFAKTRDKIISKGYSLKITKI